MQKYRLQKFYLLNIKIRFIADYITLLNQLLAMLISFSYLTKYLINTLAQFGLQLQKNAQS